MGKKTRFSAAESKLICLRGAHCWRVQDGAAHSPPLVVGARHGRLSGGHVFFAFARLRLLKGNTVQGLFRDTNSSTHSEAAWVKSFQWGIQLNAKVGWTVVGTFARTRPTERVSHWTSLSVYKCHSMLPDFLLLSILRNKNSQKVRVGVRVPCGESLEMGHWR